jgi:hypothetical protein
MRKEEVERANSGRWPRATTFKRDEVVMKETEQVGKAFASLKKIQVVQTSDEQKSFSIFF